MLKVCFPFVGNAVGGSHLSALDLIRCLPDQGVCPLVVLHQEGPLAGFFERAGICFELLSWSDFAQGKRATYAADKLRLMAALPHFAEFLRLHRINIVHSNDNQIGRMWIGSAASGGARFVWHQRTSGGKHLFQHFASRADRILCPSTFIREGLLESAEMRGGSLRRKIWQINNPISLVGHSDGCHSKSADAGGYPRVGFVGRAVPGKRPEIFLAAARRVVEIFPNARFLVAGTFDDEVRSKLLAHLPGSVVGRIEFLGFVEDRKSLYQRMDVLMVPAINEGFGRTLVEAMLAGVVVVAADSGGHREIIKHRRTGLLVPPDDVEVFVGAICELASDPEARGRLVDAARRETSSNYDPSAVTQQIANIYRQLPSLGIVQQKWRVLLDRRWLRTECRY